VQRTQSSERRAGRQKRPGLSLGVSGAEVGDEGGLLGGVGVCCGYCRLSEPVLKRRELLHGLRKGVTLRYFGRDPGAQRQDGCLDGQFGEQRLREFSIRVARRLGVRDPAGEAALDVIDFRLRPATAPAVRLRGRDLRAHSVDFADRGVGLR